MTYIEDGAGRGRKAKVDQDQALHTHSLTRSETKEGTQRGEGFNLSSGVETITGATAMLYIRNNDVLDLHIDLVVVGMGAGTYTAGSKLEVIKNPTTGTMIAAAADAPIVSNQDFGSSIPLSNVLVYHGTDGQTITDGTTHAVLFLANASASGNTRSAAGFPWKVPRGSAVGFRVTPGSTSLECYVAAVGYMRAPDE